MIDKIKQLKKKIEQDEIRREQIKERILSLKEKKIAFSDQLENAQKAKVIVQIVAKETQKKIEYHISNLVSMALASVFPDPYTFELRFEQRRNKTEADLIFIKNENETDDILNAGGGGPADVASFALRTALQSISIQKTRDILILDEPFKCLSQDRQEKCSEMIKEISEKLGIQIIIVSHLPEIINSADKIITVSNKNGISSVS